MNPEIWLALASAVFLLLIWTTHKLFDTRMKYVESMQEKHHEFIEKIAKQNVDTLQMLEQTNRNVLKLNDQMIFKAAK